MEPESRGANLPRDPYAETPADKKARLLNEMNDLTSFHAEHCEPYRRILNAAFGGRTNFGSLAELPVLPVRLFKEIDLFSFPKEEMTRTMTSSGTTGQRPSRIFLDKETATAQAHALVRIARSYLGNKRLPMLILDHPSVLKNRSTFSARGAGIVGFSQFGSDHTYALVDETMEPNWDAIEAFRVRHEGERILLFGFTSILWQHLVRAVEETGQRYDFGDGILIHGGGWKKLADQKISNAEFKRRVSERLNVRTVYNYYGMVEQTGSIYMECEAGFFHSSDYSEILIRDSRTLLEQDIGKPGLIETLSTIPRSYPGHVLLTEDVGIIHGHDGCSCSRRGNYFTVLGRLADAELRGCSDTYVGAS
jgi:hypothetical protein